ncbi:LanC-like protein [Ideonella azotifigens]|uniref:Lanthionine synthetase n=1 Tax=Ideonella azotifigens TaxID=513160 RepID=A0ABP3VU74_9BURK|nr:LanC-like protein [Ideonella azotifigens]MCD2340427.1 LanC-like protein [Ideonella azotifigens]
MQVATTVSNTLFDPARHEGLNGPLWDEAAARAAVQRMVQDALQDFSPQGLWRAHALDDPATPDTRYSMLYFGAGGIIWALRHLSRQGFVEPAELARFDATVPTLVQRNREVGETHLAGTQSLFMGDSGLLLLQWQAAPSQAVADQLFDVVQGNLHHPAREMLWGSPGTLVAAIHMAEATGEPRWAELFARGVNILWDEMVFDAELGAWLWWQDLYGKVVCYIGAGHGFAGNLYPVMRGAALLPPAVVQGFADRALQTVQALAMRQDGCTNWPPSHPQSANGKMLVQDCHGAPGIVCRLAGAPRTPAWDALLLDAGQTTWRAGPLAKGSGLCHGTAGNGYALLKLWQRSGDALWLARARAFAMHAATQVDAQREASGHARHSLWTGDIGVALFIASCLQQDSRLPMLDVF